MCVGADVEFISEALGLKITRALRPLFVSGCGWQLPVLELCTWNENLDADYGGKS